METYEQIKNEEYRIKTKALLDELPDYCTSFLNGALRDKQPRTRLSYLQDLRIFFIYLKQTNPTLSSIAIKDINLDILNNLKREDIVEYDMWLESYYIDGRHITNEKPGRKRKISTLRVFYNFLVNTAEYITNNPAAKVKPAKIADKEVIRTVEADELPKLYDVLDRRYEKAVQLLEQTPEDKRNQRIKLGPAIAKRDYAIFALFIGTGLRITELIGINTLDIKWDAARINIIIKGGKSDHIYMPDEVVDAVSEYCFEYRDMFSDFDEEDALFLSSKHCRITDRQVERLFKELCDEALGEKHGLTPHKLRATFATNHLRKFNDVSATAKVLHHKSVDTTIRHYAKPSEKVKLNVRNMDIRKIEE